MDQKIVFSTTWKILNFNRFLPKAINSAEPRFIISDNFSPFGNNLLDAFIELAFNYDRNSDEDEPTRLSQMNYCPIIDEQQQDLQSTTVKDKWDYLSLHVNIRSYFKQSIQVQCSVALINEQDNRQFHEAECTQLIDQTGRINFDPFLSLTDFTRCCGPFSPFCGCRTRPIEHLAIYCQVKAIRRPEVTQQLTNAVHPFTAKYLTDLNFNTEHFTLVSADANTRLEGFWHCWTLKEYQKIFFEDEAQESVALCSETFRRSFKPQDQFMLMLIGLKDPEVDDEEETEEKKKWTLFLYPKTLSFKDVQFRISVFDGEGQNICTFAAKAEMSQNIDVLGAKLEQLLQMSNDKLTFYIEGHICKPNEKRLQILNYLRENSADQFNCHQHARTFNHQWTIHNCDALFRPTLTGCPGLLLESQLAVPFQSTNYHYSLVLFPNGIPKTPSKKSYFSLGLICTEELPLEKVVTVQLAISLLDEGGRRVKVVRITTKLINLIIDERLLQFATKEDLVEKYLTADRKLKILIEGQVFDQSHNLSPTEDANIFSLFSFRKQPPPPSMVCPQAHFTATTDVLPFHHKWIIEGYAAMYEKEIKRNNLLVDSTTKAEELKISYLETSFLPRSSVACKMNLKIKLICHPFGLDEANDQFVGIFLQFEGDCCRTTEEEVLVQYKISFLDKKGNKCNLKVGLKHLSATNNEVGISQFIPIKELFSMKNIHLLPKDNLTIYCEGELFLAKNLSETEQYCYHQLFICTEIPPIDKLSISTETVKSTKTLSPEKVEQLIREEKIFINIEKMQHFVNSIVNSHSNVKMGDYTCVNAENLDEVLKRKAAEPKEKETETKKAEGEAKND